MLKLAGHRYGSSLVPFSAEDKEALKYKTEKCFKMLGFTKAENVSVARAMPIVSCARKDAKVLF